MATYAVLLWGQTLLALAALGLAGGWALWPFRRSDRPFLWLAAPLAGLAALAFGLTFAHDLCRLTVPAAFAVSFGVCAVLTAACLMRLPRPIPPLRWKAALLAAAAVSAWAAFATNRTSVLHGEPTLTLAEGSDAFGYAMTADWLLRHPHERAAFDAERPSEAYIHIQLYRENSRPAAFLLQSVASWARGTTALFSYDWANGIVLAAGAAALAGLFASGRRGLLLLLAAAAVSAWLTATRTGYFAKALAYPGYFLLAFVYLETWRGWSFERLTVAGLLGAGVSVSLNPAASASVLALVFGGGAVALTAHRLLGAGVPGFEGAARVPWRDLARGAIVYALTAGPTLALHRLLYDTGLPVYPLPWSRLFPVALDVENFSLPLVGAPLSLALMGLALALNVVLLALAYRGRDVAAQSFLLCTALLPVAWVLDKKQLFAFHGILFPMTAVGAALLCEGLRAGKRPRLAAVALALGFGLVLLRAPQARLSWDRYVAGGAGGPRCYRQSEMDAVAAAVGGGTLDVTVADVHACAAVVTELANARGLRVQYSGPAWERLLCWTGWPPPVYAAKGDFTLADARGWAPPGAVRFRGEHFAVAADRNALTFGAWLVPHGPAWDASRRPCFWQGNAASELEIWNGTGGTARAEFVADGQPGPGIPGLANRTLRYALGECSGEVAVGAADGWRARAPLAVPPGRHRLRLSVAEPATARPIPGDPRDLLLLLTDCRLVTVSSTEVE